MSARRLVEELGAELPATVAALPDETLAALADALASARQEQSRALTAATERALGFLPRLLRGPVASVLLR
ncbi:MAG: hypothetical protein JWN84_1972 [Nocardioides sp.]|jgi:hypothetical protein|nr:hypothetical protein [Nocardioides sp.]